MDQTRLKLTKRLEAGKFKIIRNFVCQRSFRTCDKDSDLLTVRIRRTLQTMLECLALPFRTRRMLCVCWHARCLIVFKLIAFKLSLLILGLALLSRQSLQSMVVIPVQCNIELFMARPCPSKMLSESRHLVS